MIRRLLGLGEKSRKGMLILVPFRYKYPHLSEFKNLCVMAFRVLTFNMQFGQSWNEENSNSGCISLPATTEFLQEQEADVILLQEVEQARPEGLQIEPPQNYTWLRQAFPEMQSVFAYPPVNSDELPFGIALAIFAKTPLKDFFSEILPAPSLQFEFESKKVKPTPRQLIGVTTFFGKREVRILNTHLQAFFMIYATSNDYPQQRNEVEKILRETSLPTILGGDFNCGPGEDVVEQFRNAGFATSQNSIPTWRRRPYVLDHIFYNAFFRKTKSAVLPTPCSDHHAVLAEFEFTF
ncbi:MAG: endonuclease [Verrucomicrobia bacterium]|nr:MAG: endonuclease [Verrucomicrobiota bacterium]